MTRVFDYELLDSGNGVRVERFGTNVIARPESICIWKRSPEKYRTTATATLKTASTVEWQKTKHFDENWIVDCQFFNMHLYLSGTKNIGIFPEQIQNWQWISQKIKKANRSVSVLNLFGYTGGATLAAASAGAKVCHVDASKSVIDMAKKNQKLSGLEAAPIRWIMDDCIKFVQREVKRGARYDAIILDPPAYGRDKDGNVFKFEQHVPYLLELCKQILAEKPLFLLLNGYSMNYSHFVLANLLKQTFTEERIESGELCIKEQGRNIILPCGIYARFSAG